jgi:hypothetical protein
MGKGKSKEKLEYSEWVEKYFDKDGDHSYWTSIYEACEIGSAPSDMSRYKEKDLKEEYALYKENKNDFIKYDESTNELVKEPWE